MFNKENYKKMLIIRTTKRCLIYSLSLIVINLLLSLIYKLYLFFAIVDLLPILYCLIRVIKIIRYNLVLGKIVDVTLENFYDDPYTYAAIEFNTTNNKRYKLKNPISHWGDYYKEDEEQINKMFEDDKIYINKQVPVFYNKNNPNKNFVYIEDTILKKDVKKEEN